MKIQQFVVEIITELKFKIKLFFNYDPATDESINLEKYIYHAQTIYLM